MKEYGEDFWIDTMRFFTTIALLGIIIVGGAIGYFISRAVSNQVIFVIAIVVSIIVGILTVGFVMVFLNMATDIKITKEYLMENGRKWIPGRTYSRPSNKSAVTSVSIPVGSTKCTQCGSEFIKSGDNFCDSCGGIIVWT